MFYFIFINKGKCPMVEKVPFFQKRHKKCPVGYTAPFLIRDKEKEMSQGAIS